MCGLVGIASSSMTQAGDDFFTNLLYFDMIRGPHSTGVAVVNRSGDCTVYKRALMSCDFIQLKAYKNILLAPNTALMGHNRFATKGAKDDDNAHPFKHGTITMMHNGTLTKTTVHDGDIAFDTDSESICYALSQTKDANTVLESLEGAYALVWHDSEDNTIHFARNSERTLWMGWVGADLVWASEKNMITLAAEHNKAVVKDLELLEVGKHLYYKADNLSEGGLYEEFDVKKPHIRIIGGSMSGMAPTNNSSLENYIGEYMSGWIYAVKDTGYCKASSDTGDEIKFCISKDLVKKWRAAADIGGMVRGKVTSASHYFSRGQPINNFSLSGKGLELIDLECVTYGDGLEACGICKQPIEASEVCEQHGSEYFHERCLDVYTSCKGVEGNVL